MKNNIIENKIKNARWAIERYQEEISLLEAQKTRTASAKGIEKWLGNDFESSSSLTEEYAEFAKDYKRELTKMLAPEFEIVSFNRGHFYLSFFFTNKETGRMAYVMTSDLRGATSGDGWYTNLIVRTAEHIKDYMGGQNNWTSWKELKNDALKLTK